MSTSRSGSTPTRRQALSLPLGLLAALPATAIAQGQAQAQAQGTWPDRPVRVIVGFPAGGPTDFPARLLQDPLGQLWGQPIVIENRAGAASVLASEVVAKTAPDGYTLLMAASVHASNPAVYPRLPYDTLRDFTPIICLYASPTVLFVPPNSPFRTVQELVAEIRRNPGMNYATSGNGVSGHFAGAMFALRHKLELQPIAYRGAAPALQDVVAGRVPMTFSTLAGALGLAKDGKLRALAIAAPARAPLLPEVPTLAEAGFPIPDTSPWYGFIGPAGMPEAVVQKIARDVEGIMRRPDMTRRVLDQAGVMILEGPAAFRERIRHEMAETAEVARVANIRSE
jgi:tripartite-type tricarboxylate transporter receptor subunit TctC